MNHNLWLLKHWPKEDQPNLDPVIYCLEEEFNEEQAIKVLKANEKPDYLAVLVEIVGFDTFQECLEAVNGPNPFQKYFKPKTTQINSCTKEKPTTSQE